MSREELHDIVVANIMDDYSMGCNFTALVEEVLRHVPEERLWAYLNRRQAENASPSSHNPAKQV